MSAACSVVTLSVPLATVVPRNETFLAHAQEVVKMACYGERFNQQAAFESIVAEKE
jgi:hypothetical protein